jgi:hypothetical protein
MTPGTGVEFQQRHIHLLVGEIIKYRISIRVKYSAMIWNERNLEWLAF